MSRILLKHPSAAAPIVMSLAGLALVLGHAAVYGIVHESDEGTPAHLFQLLMVAQLPIIVFFACKWIPESPKRALPILALQLGVAGLAVLSVFLLT